MKNKPYFPMFIDLSDKNIVVVGGGNIATPADTFCSRVSTTSVSFAAYFVSSVADPSEPDSSFPSAPAAAVHRLCMKKKIPGHLNR